MLCPLYDVALWVCRPKKCRNELQHLPVPLFALAQGQLCLFLGRDALINQRKPVTTNGPVWRYRHRVAQHTVEINVGVALGATKWRVRRFILQVALTHVGTGLLIGIPAGVANAQLMSSQLFGVEAYDPGIILSAVLALAIVATVAALLPARKASTIEPMRALRER